MAFTAAQLTSFFETNPQMGLTRIARRRLAAEGLATVDDFGDFKPDQIDEAIKNLRTSIPGTPGMPAQLHPVTGAIVIPAVPPIPPIPPCIIPARCALRLKIASIAYKYYIDTARTVTSVNMHYTNVLRDFYTEWEAIKQQSKEDKPTVPSLSKNMTPVKWIESFKDCLYRTNGVRNCPIAYVIRETVDVPDEETQPLLNGKAFSQDAGSVLQELLNRYAHDHPLYRTDNNSTYSLLDEATRGTVYAPTIKPYSRTKNGRSAWEAIISSHAGNDKWEQIEKSQTKFMINHKWNGKQYGLDKFTNLHRTAFVALQEAGIHVNFQLPNEHTRVGYLIDNINNSDPDLRAALASIRANTNGMRDNFETAVTFMLPVCPYAKHSRNRNNHNNPIISEITLKGKQHSKTGVDFRWHTPDEYHRLSKEQRQELYQWQKTKQGKAAMSKSRARSGQGRRTSNINKMSKKQLRAKVAALQGSNGDFDDDSKGEETYESNHNQKSFTLDQVKAMISAAASHQPKQVNIEDKPPPSSNKRKATDEYAAAALHLQEVIQRSKQK